MTKIARTGIAGTGIALSALLAWSMAVAQSQSPAPAVKAPTQVAQGTTGIPSTITRGALGQAPEAGGLLAAETTVAIGGAVVAGGVVSEVASSPTPGAAAATSTK